MQIVVHHNTVVDYCEHGYVCMGTTVICPSKGLTFQDCEIVTVKSVPADIDTRKYDYENGLFVPSEKGVPFGVATLDGAGKIPSGQLPEISSVKTFVSVIGTSWTENEDTGVKSQNVAIEGVTADNTAKVDHAYTGNGTSQAYAQFVEEENQYLTYITNGYAETYNGGITFYIFGDAPTVAIPIVVEVV